MGFIKYTDNWYYLEPRCSINKKGEIYFGQGAKSKYDLDNCKYLVLYFDKANRKIGMEFMHGNSKEGAIKLRSRNATYYADINKFLDFYGIKQYGLARYYMTRDVASKLITIDLR